MFLETVKVDGREMPRFQPMGSSSDNGGENIKSIFDDLPVQFEDGMVEKKVGDFINIPAFKKQRVDWTTPDESPIWLGVRYGDGV